MVKIKKLNIFKYLIILIISFNFNSYTLAQTGKGELKLNSEAIDFFIKYLKGTATQWPQSFLISEDSSWYMFYYCAYGAGQCGGSDMPGLAKCRKESGKKCGTFAVGRTVKWKNGINPGKGKVSRFNSKWDRSQIIAKLTELGFYDDTPKCKITKEKKPKLTKKKEKSGSDKTNLVDQLKALKDLYNSGDLSKEQYEKAKKKLLD